MVSRSPVIDVQVHCYQRNTAETPWAGFIQGPEEMTGDDMVAAMDGLGIDGALLVSPFAIYRYDPSYALSVYEKHPTRFGVIRPFDPTSESIEAEMEEWTGRPGVVGARIMLTAYDFWADHPGLNRIMAAAGRAGVPVNVMCSTRLPVLGELAKQNPNTRVVIDHLGIVQPSEPPAPPEAWADLPLVLSLAELDNVAIKISGAGTLAHEPFPYGDIWEPLRMIFDAFGFERCMWGTDWTRAINLLTYEQGVEAFRVTDELSDSERAALMGGTLREIYKWEPGG